MTDQPPEPTARDRENEQFHREIADRQRREYNQILAWADRIMGRVGVRAQPNRSCGG